MFSDGGDTAPISISSVEDYPSIRIVRLRGPIDRTTVTELERFRKWVAKHPGFKHKHVILDFKSVTHMDTSAVAEMLQAVSELKSAHFRLGAIHLSETFSGMLEVLKVDKWITIFKDQSEAVEALK